MGKNIKKKLQDIKKPITMVKQKKKMIEMQCEMDPLKLKNYLEIKDENKKIMGFIQKEELMNRIEEVEQKAPNEWQEWSLKYLKLKEENESLVNKIHGVAEERIEE